jgi:hypothetical protein
MYKCELYTLNMFLYAQSCYNFQYEGKFSSHIVGQIHITPNAEVRL